MTLYFLNDVFLLYLSLKPAKSILEGLSLLQSNLCQTDYTPKLVPKGPVSYCKVTESSQAECKTLDIGFSPRPNPASSKPHPQRHLDLPWSVRIRRRHEIRRLSIVGREVIDSNDLLLL